MIKGLRARVAAHRGALRDRLALLIAVAVFCAIAVTGVAAYLITLTAVYTELDNELTTVANITSTMLADDLESMGGINESALKAANVNLEVLRADNKVFQLPNTPNFVSSTELAVAMTGEGVSTRTAEATDGTPYRIIAVPLIDENSSARYALVLARPLTSTLAILNSLLGSLFFFGALAIVAAAAIGFSIARSTTQTLQQLSAAVGHVATTNRLVPISVDGTDEVADLGRAFNRMLKALGSSRERQRRLIADAGHELRTPLTSMRTNVELLVADDKSGMLPSGARGDILRDVAAQLGEFTTLIGDLVQLSREEGVQPHPEPIDFRDVVDSALIRVKRRGPGITWEVEIDNGLYLLGEPDALERAVTNLLDNAVKFSPPNGTIQVVLNGNTLRVADSGPGISEDDLPHVFERFYRSDQARNTPGSGLGLSIVVQTIEAHGGTVRAGHATKGGAEFIVKLPGSLTPPEDDEPDPKPAAD